MAVERALAADPDYSLARLLGQALESAVDPAVFRLGLRSAAQRRADAAAAGGPGDGAAETVAEGAAGGAPRRGRRGQPRPRRGGRS
jgi:hypothetical protein